MSLLVELAEDADEGALRVAVDAVVAHHDALRTRFSRDDQGWSQQVGPAASGGVLHSRDLSELDGEAQRAAIEDAAAGAQTKLDIGSGRLLAAVLFVLGRGRRPRLFLAAHHLAVDGVSWRILLGDIETAYQQARSGRPPRLDPVGTPFQHWARRLVEHVRDGGFDQDLRYWAAVSGAAPADLPVDRDGAWARRRRTRCCAGFPTCTARR